MFSTFRVATMTLLRDEGYHIRLAKSADEAKAVIREAIEREARTRGDARA